MQPTQATVEDSSIHDEQGASGDSLAAQRVAALTREFAQEPTVPRMLAIAKELEGMSGVPPLRQELVKVIEKQTEMLDMLAAVEKAEQHEGLLGLDYAIEELDIRTENEIELQLAQAQGAIRAARRLDHLKRKIELAKNKEEYVKQQVDLAKASRTLNVPELTSMGFTPKWHYNQDRLLSDIKQIPLNSLMRRGRKFLRHQRIQRTKRRIIEHYPWISASIVGLVLIPEVLFKEAEPLLLSGILLPVMLWAIQEIILNRLLENWKFRRHCARLRQEIESICKARLQSVLQLGFSSYILRKDRAN